MTTSASRGHISSQPFERTRERYVCRFLSPASVGPRAGRTDRPCRRARAGQAVPPPTAAPRSPSRFPASRTWHAGCSHRADHRCRHASAPDCAPTRADRAWSRKAGSAACVPWCAKGRPGRRRAHRYRLAGSVPSGHAGDPRPGSGQIRRQWPSQADQASAPQQSCPCASHCAAADR